MSSQGASDAAAAARAKAMEIASRLSSTVLGKHPRDEPSSGAPRWPVSNGSGHADRPKKKLYVPVDENPDINFLGLLIGPRGSTLQQMESDSGARINIRGRGSSKDGNDDDPDEPLYVLITGDTDEQVSKASKMVSDLLFDSHERAAVKDEQLRKVAESKNLVLSSSLYAEDVDYPPFRGSGECTKSMTVPAERVGQIIGRGGDTIKMLQTRTGCCIQVSREADPASNQKTITLEGSQEQIQRAEQEIGRIIEESESRERERYRYGSAPGSGPMTDMGGSGYGYGIPPSQVIQIPSETVGLLIGRGGQTISQMQQRTRCRIQVQRDVDADPASRSRDVTLSGTEEEIDMARREIETLVQTQIQPMGAMQGFAVPGMNTKTIMVPGAMVGIIIGRGGDTIKNIQARTGARVQISKDDSGPEREVTLIGNPQAIEYAEYEIAQLTESRDGRGRSGGGSYGGYDYGAYGDPNAYAAYYGAYQGYVQDPYYAQMSADPQQQQQQQQQQQPAPTAAAGASVQQADASAAAPAAASGDQSQSADGYDYAAWNAYCQQYYAYYGQYPPQAQQQQAADPNQPAQPAAGQQQAAPAQTPAPESSTAAPPPPPPQ